MVEQDTVVLLCGIHIREDYEDHYQLYSNSYCQFVSMPLTAPEYKTRFAKQCMDYRSFRNLSNADKHNPRYPIFGEV